MKTIIKYSLVAFIAAFAAVWTFSRIQQNNPVFIPEEAQVVNTSFSAPNRTVSAMSTDFTAAAGKTIDAVVHITNTSSGRAQQPNSIWEYFYNTPSREYPRIGMGS